MGAHVGPRAGEASTEPARNGRPEAGKRSAHPASSFWRLWDKQVSRLDRNERILATLLAALAGYVDVIGFIEMGGFFVSFMSGNSTRMAVGLAEGSPDGLRAAGLIASFVVGVAAGSIVSQLAGAKRRSIVLVLTSAMLAAAAILGGHPNAALGMMLIAAAMGSTNSALDHAGEVRVALTYMTGTLVKFGQFLALALLGKRPLGWMPYLLHWLALVIGALAGAAMHLAFGLSSLGVAFAAMLMLAAAAWRLPESTG